MTRKKTLDLIRIKELVKTIEKHGVGHDVTDLMARLHQEERLTIRLSKGAWLASMAGIRASSTESERGALRNWANRARRELLKGEAA